MKQNYKTENNFTFLSNEMPGAMFNLSNKYNIPHVSNMHSENKSGLHVPGKSVIDNIMRYSRAVEVVKKTNKTPIFIIRN
ncbi:MAG: hypothetical protein KGZ97_06910 [Bacteroidetes bacterium]|nr:hypothetical protein [Bacteroidota bacterium]